MDTYSLQLDGMYGPHGRINIHGIINIYEAIDNPSFDSWVWHEYFIKFTDGKIEWIKKTINQKWKVDYNA